MNTVKNVHSPAGMGYILQGTRLKNLRDCPSCKFGTIDRRANDEGEVLFWECADCKQRFPDALIEQLYGSWHKPK